MNTTLMLLFVSSCRTGAVWADAPLPEEHRPEEGNTGAPPAVPSHTKHSGESCCRHCGSCHRTTFSHPGSADKRGERGEVARW